MGQAPESESYNVDGAGMPLIAGAGDFGEIHPVPKKYTTAPGKTCQAGDIILAIRATIGKKVFAGRQYCLGRGVAGLRPRTGLDGRYLWHWLTYAAPSLATKAKGATFKQVNREDIGALPITVPSLHEQRRIAEFLDKADALRVKRQAALVQLDTLTQSIFIDMFGDPASNTKRWPVALLREATARIQIGPFGSLLHQQDYVKGGIPLVNPKHIQQRAIQPDPSETLSARKFAELDTYHLRAGDVVMGRRGEMGRCAIVNEGSGPLLCGTGSLFVRPDNEHTTSLFLLFLLSSVALRARLERLSLGQTLPNLNSQIVESLEVPLATPCFAT